MKKFDFKTYETIDVLNDLTQAINLLWRAQQYSQNETEDDIKKFLDRFPLWKCAGCKLHGITTYNPPTALYCGPCGNKNPKT